MVADRRAIAPREVRNRYACLRPLAKISTAARGWTLDLLNLLRSLHQEEFEWQAAYGIESALARLHPANRQVRDEIRQQRQVLRDAGFVRFLGRGRYRLLKRVMAQTERTVMACDAVGATCNVPLVSPVRSGISSSNQN